MFLNFLNIHIPYEIFSAKSNIFIEIIYLTEVLRIALLKNISFSQTKAVLLNSVQMSTFMYKHNYLYLRCVR